MQIFTKNCLEMVAQVDNLFSYRAIIYAIKECSFNFATRVKPSEYTFSMIG